MAAEDATDARPPPYKRTPDARMVEYVLDGKFTVIVYAQSWDKTTSTMMLRLERKCLKEGCCDVVNFTMAAHTDFKNSACLRPWIQKLVKIPADTL